uniref:Uncharacterized protein n=1 Tax=Arundo donax TaxID=35708 RepID=A0A0A8ZZH3_ARUDO
MEKKNIVANSAVHLCERSWSQIEIVHRITILDTMKYNILDTPRFSLEQK